MGISLTFQSLLEFWHTNQCGDVWESPLLFTPSHARGGEVQGPVSQQASTTVPGIVSHTRRYFIIYMYVLIIVLVFWGGGGFFKYERI